MLKLNSITTALKEKVQNLFPNHTAYTDLVRQGFERPSFLVELGQLTMEDTTARTVEVTVQAKITLFEVVDTYNDTQVALLADELSKLMVSFTGRAVAVEDRYLDIGKVTGQYGNDFAEISFPLAWQDDRELNEPVYEPAKNYDMDFTVR